MKNFNKTVFSSNRKCKKWNNFYLKYKVLSRQLIEILRELPKVIISLPKNIFYQDLWPFQNKNKHNVLHLMFLQNLSNFKDKEKPQEIIKIQWPDKSEQEKLKKHIFSIKQETLKTKDKKLQVLNKILLKKIIICF